MRVTRSINSCYIFLCFGMFYIVHTIIFSNKTNQNLPHHRMQLLLLDRYSKRNVGRLALQHFSFVSPLISFPFVTNWTHQLSRNVIRLLKIHNSITLIIQLFLWTVKSNNSIRSYLYHWENAILNIYSCKSRKSLVNTSLNNEHKIRPESNIINKPKQL